MDDPVVEGSLCRRMLAGGMAPPAGLAILNGGIGRDMVAGEERHPHMTGLEGGDVFRLVMDHPPAGTHPPHVVDRLGIDRVFRGYRAMGDMRQALSFADQELVMDP